MMGHRGKLIDGDEWDALTRRRHFVCWRVGERKRIKNKYWRRQRRAARQITRLQKGEFNGRTETRKQNLENEY